MQNNKDHIIKLIDKLKSLNTSTEKHALKSEILEKVKSDLKDVNQIYLSSLETFIVASIDLQQYTDNEIKRKSLLNILTKIYG